MSEDRTITAPFTGRAARRLRVWGLPALVTVAWLVAVPAAGHLQRVLDHLVATVTMVFGSFVAGSTPQGGGAVAFPVFTKLLHMPAAPARTFSLSIQAVGMVVASATILLAGRTVERRAVVLAGGGGLVGFFAAVALLTDPTAPFRDAVIPDPWIKVSFTIVLAAMAYIVKLSLRPGRAGALALSWNPRVTVGVVAVGLLGGIASALTGSGVDVLVFLFVVVLAGLHPRVGVPTSIIAMAVVSSVGAAYLAVVDGQLAIHLGPGGVVRAVGDRAVGPLPADRFDVFGMWLAAIPVVVWGAPLGAWLVSVMTERALIGFVAAMAALEVATTVVFLDELRSDPYLAAYTVVGIVAAPVIIRMLVAGRHRLLRTRWSGGPPDPG